LGVVETRQIVGAPEVLEAGWKTALGTEESFPFFWGDFFRVVDAAESSTGFVEGASIDRGDDRLSRGTILRDW